MRKYYSLLFSVLLALTCFVATQGQGGVGSTRGLPETSGGSNTIQGHVFFPDGHSADRRLRVNLDSTDEPSRSTQTDEDGTFHFNGLKQGSYTVTVEGGKDYETVREPVFFEGSHHNTVVPIHMKSKAAGEALAKVPKPAREAYMKGIDAADKNDSKKAAEFLEQAVAQYAQFPQALTELGRQYMLLGKPDKAAEAYRSLLKINAGDANAHLDLGIALYNLSSSSLVNKKTEEATARLSEAEQQLRQAIELKSSGPNAHYYLGLVLIRLKKYPEAQSEMESVISNGGENLAPAHKYLGGLYMSAKRNKDAADQLDKYLQLDPKAKDADQIRGTIKDLRNKQ